MFRDLDESQNRAVLEIEKHLYVTASAGTGKTEVLTRRFLHILEKRKASISQILAITFTEKAANEMKERIFKFIIKKLKNSTTAADFNYWKEVKKNFRHNQISTIHSFCSKSIREYAFELGIDPEFTIIEENELRFELSVWIKNLSIEMVENNDSDFKKLLDSYSYPDLKNLFITFFLNHYKLEKEIIPLLNSFDSVSDYNLYLKQHIEKVINKSLNNCLNQPSIKEIFKNINYLSDLYKGRDNTNFAKHLMLLEEIINDLKEKKLHPEIKVLFITDKKFSAKKDIELWGEDLKSTYKEVLHFLSPFRWYLSEILFQIREIDFNNRDFQLVRVLINIYQQWKSRLNSLSQSYPVLYNWHSGGHISYDELQTITLELLKDHSFSNEVRGDLQSKLKFIMVDECQDIDPVQQEIISLICDINENTPNLFVVGDEKQSIYKFRGADITIFKELTNKIKLTNDKTYHLDINYRSQNYIVQWMNYLFKHIMPEEGSQYEVQFQHKLEANRESSNIKNHIECILHNDDRKKEAENIAKRIVSLISQNYDFGDIAIILRALTELSVYEEILNQFEIPYTVYSGRGFYKEREIIDCFNLLRFINNDTDELSLAGLLRSPFCNISDKSLYWLSHYSKDLLKGLFNYKKIDYLEEEEKLKLHHFKELIFHLKQKKDRISISSLLQFALDSTNYEAILLTHKGAADEKLRIRHLIEKIKKLEREKARSLQEVLDYFDMLMESDQEENPASHLDDKYTVKILTVHKSKGMEFPVVILPNMDRGKGGDRGNSLCYLDKDLGIILNNHENLSYYKYLKYYEGFKETAENKRLFYVAATRARDLLILSSKAKDYKRDAVYNSSSSWYDFFMSALYKGNENINLLIDKFEDGKSINYQLSHEELRIGFYYNYHIEDKSSINFENSKALNKELKVLKIKDEVPLEKLTATELVEYSKCPRKYYYKFICNIIELHEGLGPYFRAKENETENKWPKDIPLNLVGNIVHSVLEKLDIDRHNVLEIINSHINNLTLSVLSRDEDKEKLEQQLLKLIRDYLDSDLFQIINENRVKSPENQYNEFGFFFKLQGIEFEGSIDKVYKDDEGKYHIIDYKTNHFPDQKKYKQVLENKKYEYEKQMQIYMHAVNLLLGEVWKGALLFLDIGEEVEPIQNFNMEKIKYDIQADLKNLDLSLSTDKPLSTFKTIPSANCDFCGYWMCEGRKK